MREQDPVFYDALFRQKRKGGKWRVMPSPVLEGPVADTHAHLQMLADPAASWPRRRPRRRLRGDHRRSGRGRLRHLRRPASLAHGGRARSEGHGRRGRRGGWHCRCPGGFPMVRIAAGVHPHNAKEWEPSLEAALREYLRDRRVSAVGEIGLDYHYDLVAARCAARGLPCPDSPWPRKRGCHRAAYARGPRRRFCHSGRGGLPRGGDSSALLQPGRCGGSALGGGRLLHRLRGAAHLQEG